ncbi:MAG: hypothetical protein P1V97_12025 [Planctomycetota bacterium]|nr:hypothetical protein [Planctomycetota bacterium]
MDGSMDQFDRPKDASRNSKAIIFLTLISFSVLITTYLLWPQLVALVFGGKIIVNESLADADGGSRRTIIVHYEDFYLLNKHGQYKLLGDDLRGFLGLKKKVLHVSPSKASVSPLSRVETVCYWWDGWRWKSDNFNNSFNAESAKLVHLDSGTGPYLYISLDVYNPIVYGISQSGVVKKEVPIIAHLIDHDFPTTSPGITHRTEVETLFNKLNSDSLTLGTRGLERSNKRKRVSMVYATGLFSCQRRVKEIGLTLGATEAEIVELHEIVYKESIQSGRFLNDKEIIQFLQGAIESREEKTAVPEDK